MLRWVCALVTAVVVTGFAFLLVTGRYSNDGSVVIRVTSGHGLHEGDLFVIAGWVVAMASLAVLTGTPARPREP